jgi:hypothetical protein
MSTVVTWMDVPFLSPPLCFFRVMIWARPPCGGVVGTKSPAQGSFVVEVEILSAHTSLSTDSYGVVGLICISEEPSFSFGPINGYYSYLILTMSIVMCLNVIGHVCY